MLSYYSIVRFVPNPMAEEFVNVGVVAFGEGRMHAHFLRNLHRVQRFGERDVRFLRDVERWIRDAANAQLQLLEPAPGEVRFSEAILEALVAEWSNCIQFSAPRASILAPEELLRTIASRFLRERILPPKQPGRPEAKHLAIESISRAVRDRVAGAADRLVHSDYSVRGALVEHEFDVGIANGHAIGVAQGISFRVGDSRELIRQVDALAYAIIDVKRVLPELPIAIVALRPQRLSEAYDRAAYTFQQIGARLVTDDSVGIWSAEMADRAVRHLESHRS